jgi:hypothetical protein
MQVIMDPKSMTVEEQAIAEIEAQKASENPKPVDGIDEAEIREKVAVGLTRLQAVEVIKSQAANDKRLEAEKAKEAAAPKGITVEQLNSAIKSLEGSLGTAISRIGTLESSLSSAQSRIIALEQLAADNAAAAQAAKAAGAETARSADTTSDTAPAASAKTAKGAK